MSVEEILSLGLGLDVTTTPVEEEDEQIRDASQQKRMKKAQNTLVHRSADKRCICRSYLSHLLQLWKSTK